MRQQIKKPRFKINETGYHRFAVKELAAWVNGLIEQPFYIDDKIVFIPDVICKENGQVTNIYEIVYTHPVNGKKLGVMQYWCYLNNTLLRVSEVSAHYILKQVKNPGFIETIEFYDINPLNL